MRFLICLVAFFFLVGHVASNDAIFPDHWLGPSDILVAEDPGVLYVLEQDAGRIRKTGVNGGVPSLLALPAEPKRMRLFPDKKHLAVVGGGPCGRLWIVDLDSFTVTADIPVGHSPNDVAVFQSPEGKTTFYVANRFGGDISVVEAIDDTSGREIRRIPAGREPIALTVTPDGKTLVVGGHLPEDSSLQFSISARARFVDVETGRSTSIRLDVGAINLRDVALTPDGRYACFTGQIGHFQQMPNTVNAGWMNENILFVVDVPGRKAVVSHRLDDFAIGSANPWGVSLSTDGSFLVVAAAGSCDLILINVKAFVNMLDGFIGYPVKDDEKTVLHDRLPLHMRIPIGLKGVRHAVMTNDRTVYAASYFEDSVARIVCRFSEPLDYVSGALPQDDLEIPRNQPWKLRPDVNTPVRTNFRPDSKDGVKPANVVFPATEAGAPLRFQTLSTFVLAPGIRFERSFARLGPEPVWTDVRYGEVLFHDATLCEEHWQSCTSCHPEGRSDTLNWDLLNDGQDNPKNSKSMLLSHDTPPSMSHGVRDRAETAVRKGFETILMIPATEEEAGAVDAYLSSLKPVPGPGRVFDRSKNEDRGALSEAAKRGRRIFNSDRSGCHTCHPEPLFTDMRLHDVGTRSAFDTGPMFDTPTLIEVWRTAPYLHDGRYTTIRELIVDGKHVHANGRFEELTEQDIDDLVEYVLSL